MATKIQLRRDTSTNWTANNPILDAGELGFETDTGKFKIGNGTSTWTSKVYSSVSASELSTKADTATTYSKTEVDALIPTVTPETVTSISINANVITYTDEDGNTTDIDLSLYLDDSNLARITEGTLDNASGIATFTRDDSSTFTVDLSNLSTTAFADLTDKDIAGFDQTVSSLGTVTADTGLANIAGKVVNITMGGDFAITGHDLTTGQSANLIVAQDATGTRLLTWPAGTKFAGGNADLSTDADAVDIVGVFYDGTILYVSISTGYATV